jgi:hypothetical protein
MKTISLFAILFFSAIGLQAQTPAKVLDNASTKESVIIPPAESPSDRRIDATPIIIGTMTPSAFEESVEVSVEKNQPSPTLPEVKSVTEEKAMPAKKE